MISITDGQIYLESDLFNAGVRPAVNAGLSGYRAWEAGRSPRRSARYGRASDSSLHEYQSLAAFSQFGSDLDEATQKRIVRGKRIIEILKQPQFAPMDDLAQIVSIHAAGEGLLDARRRLPRRRACGHVVMVGELAGIEARDARGVRELVVGAG